MADDASPSADVSDPPLACTMTRELAVAAATVFRAWTEGMDTWFAAPGRIRMRPVTGEPFWLETEYEGRHHPHYGRVLAVEPDRLYEITWMTGRLGTDGAETVVRVELTQTERGTELRLTQSGFYDEKARRQHADAWVQVLAHLEDVLTG